MKSITLPVFVALILAVAVAWAGEIREIELKDGSIISGEVVSLSGGVFTIKSESLGTIKLDESKVRAIRTKAAAAGPAPAGKAVSGGDSRDLQEKMMSDREIMALIESLKDDQEFKKLLQDPAIMKAVQSGDVSSLMSNPQFLKLLDNPTVKEIEKKVK